MKRIPRWAKILIAFVVVLVIIGLALPYFLDVERYRPTILAAIEKETGRTATIGKIRARFLPSIGFTIEDFSLGSPAGFGDHPLATVGVIQGTLAWGPLLRKKYRVSGIHIVRPKVQLLEDEHGTTNYDFPAKPAGASTGDAASFELADVDGIEISGAEVLMAQVTGKGEMRPPSFRAANVNVMLKDVALNADLLTQWRVESDLKGVQLTLPGLAPVALTSGRATLASGAATIAFATTLGKAAAVSGTVRIDNVAKGGAHFDLNTPLLDLDQLATAKAPVTAGAAPALESLGSPRSTPKRQPGAPSTEPLAAGRVTADRVRLAPFEATGAHVEVRVFSDHIEASPLGMDLYEGTLDVSARLDHTADPARISATIDLRQLAVGKLMTSLAANRKLTGTAAITAQITAALGDHVLESLTGKGQATVRNGTMPGFEMNGLMGGLAKLQKVVEFGTDKSDFNVEIPYRSVVGDFSVAASRVHSRRIFLDSSAGTVELSGSAGFDAALDYDGKAGLMGSRENQRSDDVVSAIKGMFRTAAKHTIGRVNFPFTVRGTLSDPKVNPR